MPAHPDAIKAAKITGHRRYMDLCDPDHPAWNPAYIPIVEAIAAGRAPTATIPTRAEPSKLGYLKDVTSCPARYREPCGCAWPFRCVLRFGGSVSLEDCQRCLASQQKEPMPDPHRLESKVTLSEAWKWFLANLGAPKPPAPKPLESNQAGSWAWWGTRWGEAFRKPGPTEAK